MRCFYEKITQWSEFPVSVVRFNEDTKEEVFVLTPIGLFDSLVDVINS